MSSPSKLSLSVVGKLLRIKLVRLKKMKELFMRTDIELTSRRDRRKSSFVSVFPCVNFYLNFFVRKRGLRVKELSSSLPEGEKRFKSKYLE